MAVRVRLQRHGKKGKPFYWIVATDSRVKRDGKFLEKLGTYNPVTNPAEIKLNVDNTVKWIRNGAQPSDTARRILSYKGVMLKYHLSVGVDKGALTQEQANKKFETWLSEKEARIDTKISDLQKEKDQKQAERLIKEKEVSKNRLKTEEVEEPKTEAVADDQPKEEKAEETKETDTKEEQS